MLDFSLLLSRGKCRTRIITHECRTTLTITQSHTYFVTQHTFSHLALILTSMWPVSCTIPAKYTFTRTKPAKHHHHHHSALTATFSHLHSVPIERSLSQKVLKTRNPQYTLATEAQVDSTHSPQRPKWTSRRQQGLELLLENTPGVVGSAKTRSPAQGTFPFLPEDSTYSSSSSLISFILI